jgi:aspartate kinase
MIVMKFGGTSVEDAAAIRRLIDITRQELSRQPAIVVSAMALSSLPLSQDIMFS